MEITSANNQNNFDFHVTQFALYAPYFACKRKMLNRVSLMFHFVSLEIFNDVRFHFHLLHSIYLQHNVLCWYNMYVYRCASWKFTLRASLFIHRMLDGIWLNEFNVTFPTDISDFNVSSLHPQIINIDSIFTLNLICMPIMKANAITCSFILELLITTWTYFHLQLTRTLILFTKHCANA